MAFDDKSVVAARGRIVGECVADDAFHHCGIGGAVLPVAAPDAEIAQADGVGHNAVADTCHPGLWLLAVAHEYDEVVEFKNRTTIAQIQTPQAFKYGLIKKAHDNAKDCEATDDCSMVMKLGNKVKLVIGDKRFSKITTSEDIKYLEGLLK